MGHSYIVLLRNIIFVWGRKKRMMRIFISAQILQLSRLQRELFSLPLSYYILIKCDVYFSPSLLSLCMKFKHFFISARDAKRARKREQSRWGVILCLFPGSGAWKYFHQTSEIAIRSTENFAALFSPQLGRKLLSWWLSEAILLSLCWVSDFSRSKRWCVCRFLLIKNADRGKMKNQHPALLHCAVDD